VTVPAAGAIPVSPLVSYQLQVLVAAAAGGDWDAGQDFLRILAIDTDTSAQTVLDEFLPNGAGNLESSFYAGVVLGTTFQDFTYALPTAANLAIRIEAYTTGDLEFLGFDDLRIVPEPRAAPLLALGVTALALGRRRAPRRATPQGVAMCPPSMRANSNTSR
jgi:hypothetical protein